MNRIWYMVSLSILTFCAMNIQAQTMITGKVIAADKKNPVENAHISLSGSANGTTTGSDGGFFIQTEKDNGQLVISALGFETRTVDFAFRGKALHDLKEILIHRSMIALEEVNIISSFATERKTPVSVSSIPQRKIQEQLGDQPFPEVLKIVPGVYSTRTGGGSGDAEVNIRGFQQENIGLLLNGIPISSVENGLIYWNNWTGLGDIARSVQVQRGLGASNVALNSVGGTINIITKTTEAKQGGFADFSTTSYGNTKFSLGLSTGLMDNGVAVSFIGSRTEGPGYVDATYVDAWAYFLSVSKSFNMRHKIVFTTMGAPERHGQRNFKLAQEEIDRHGIRFNKDWGSYNGKINNASENFYHKPWITFNHYWNISSELFLATSAYVSPGWGGGKWSDTYGWSTPTIFEYRNPSGQIDWEAIYKNNASHTDTAILSTGEQVTGFSKNVQTHFLASHMWSGLLSRLEYSPNNNFKYTAGLHLRQFRSKLQQKIDDLLGGDFYLDHYDWALAGPAGRNEIKTVGDIVKVNNGAINPSGTFFGQVEFEHKKINSFVSGSYTQTWYQRWDKYNYVDDQYSLLISKTGFDLKAGINYNITDAHHIYANGGYFSRAPYYKYVFGNFTNVPSKDLANEKIKAAEAGYGYSDDRTRVRINYYYTLWEDKNFLSNEYIQLEDDTRTRALVTGLDALHTGLEAEFEYKVTPYFDMGGALSLGDWKWKNDVTAVLFNDNNVATDTVSVYADGLYVGGAPQFQAAIFGDLQIMKKFDIAANWVYYARNHAWFDPALRTNPDDREQAFEIPAYSLLDVHFNYRFRFFDQPARFGLSCFNVFDTEHIVRGEDGFDHSLETFRGFWGFGRTFNFSLRVNF
jgi:iron complex outermembrane recepter protein